MSKFLHIVLFILASSLHLNAQLSALNIAVRKPVIPNTYTFSYTGAIQKFVVPNRVTSIQVNAIGAKGGTGARGQVGGSGANITTTLNVTPGQILYIVVGGFPGQSKTAMYGFGGDGGTGTNYGGAGGGLSGVFNSEIPANSNALVVAGGGGGGAGNALGDNYTGGDAGNNLLGTSSNGNELANINFSINGRYQYGYAATVSAAGLAGEPYDTGAGIRGTNGSDITGGTGGGDVGVPSWNGGGGAGGGYFGGGAGTGGGSAAGGGAGGSTKTTSGHNSFGSLNSIGDGSVSITCLTNSSLVLHLDAGNPASYSGTGTTWNDLSGNDSHVTLTNTTFSSANGGSIAFNGTSSYANFNANIGTTNVVTVEMWVKTNSLRTPGGGMYFGFDSYDVWTRNGNIGYNTGNSDLFGISSSQVDNLGILGNWRHLVFVMKAGSFASNKIYINGSLQSLSQQISGYSFLTANATFNSGAGRISSWRNDLNWLLDLNVASFKIYNRELTAQEIANNLKATRNRFYTDNDGLTANTASTSAYQIKQDYPNSPDGFYWIKNENINGGAPIKIYADMTTDGGGWTLLMKNSSNVGWTYSNAIDLNPLNPFSKNTDITSLSTSNYSIIKWADYIKKSASGFQYMIDAKTRGSFGGIWTANGNYSFISTSNNQTDIEINTKFGSWVYDTEQGISKRMPWHSTNAGAGYGSFTTDDGTLNWWGTLISKSISYSPTPWISSAATGGSASSANPGIIWYWVR